MKTRIAVHQTYRVERWIVIDVEAANADRAYEALANGDIDVPAAEALSWAEIRTLEHEEYRPV